MYILARWYRPVAVLVLGVPLFAGCGDSSSAPDDKINPESAPRIAKIVSAEEVLSRAHVPTMDPATMQDAEIRQALAVERFCGFRYTSFSAPVFAVSMPPAQAAAVVKLNGELVKLAPSSPSQQDQAGVLELGAGPIRVTVSPDPRELTAVAEDGHTREATATFRIDERLEAGYRGYLSCPPDSG